MKKTALLLLAVLLLAALLALTGCDKDDMLSNYTSDTFETGEHDAVTWDDIF